MREQKKSHNKGLHLNTTERYYIYAEYTKNNHLNDEHIIFPNEILEPLLQPDQPQNPHFKAVTPNPLSKAVTPNPQFKAIRPNPPPQRNPYDEHNSKRQCI